MEAVISDHDYLEKPLLECMADNMVQVNMLCGILLFGVDPCCTNGSDTRGGSRKTPREVSWIEVVPLPRLNIKNSTDFGHFVLVVPYFHFCF